MSIIVGIIILLIFSLWGFFIWACSELPLALREMTLNTRPDRIPGSSYALLKILSIIIKIFAIVIWVAGLLISFYAAYLLVTLKNPANVLSIFSQSIQ